MNKKHAWLCTLLGAVCYLVARYLRVAEMFEEEPRKGEGIRHAILKSPGAILPKIKFLGPGEAWQR